MWPRSARLWAAAVSRACWAPAATAAAAASCCTRGAIGFDGNGQCLVEVVETIPGIGGGEHRSRLDALGALGNRRGLALLPGKFERVDGAAASESGRCHHGAVTEDRERGPAVKGCFA